MEFTFLSVYILATTLFVISFIDWKKPIDMILLVAILLGCTNELLGICDFSYYRVSTNLYVVLLISCWLFILRYRSEAKKTFFCLWIMLLLLSIVSWYFTGIENFNYANFVGGAITYLLAFMFESIYRLQREDYIYFQSDDFLLTTAPLLFFISFSFLFSFRSGPLHDYVIFKMKLFDIIAGFANIIFYSIINLYIYRQVKLRKTITP